MTSGLRLARRPPSRRRAAPRSFLWPFDLLVPEGGRDGLSSRGAPLELRERQHDVDEQLPCGAIVGRDILGQVKIGVTWSVRWARVTPKCDFLEQCGLAGRVGGRPTAVRSPAGRDAVAQAPKTRSRIQRWIRCAISYPALKSRQFCCLSAGFSLAVLAELQALIESCEGDGEVGYYLAELPASSRSGCAGT